MMFACLDFSTFLICYSGDLSGNKSEEKASVAICDGSSIIWHRLTGLPRVARFTDKVSCPLSHLVP